MSPSPSPSRYVCVHGHFYQPPRENPWLESVEMQDSAYPHHDWNQRITFECYAPNAFSRILDDEDRIEKIVNNYSRLSFNFGPTLLSWMEPNAPKVYAAVLEADRRSMERFGGHGSAIAQAYNHMILPLASPRDQVTQVRWGVADFRHRFGRAPEGMWLAETGVNLATLEVLAQEGLRFTILAPRQAHRVRRSEEVDWQDVEGGLVDARRPYRVALPSGREIAVFFYDAGVSQAIAFEGLLSSGDQLTERLLGIFRDGEDEAQLAHVATDGETYGHHQKHGDMALAYALERIDSGDAARLTNYGEYLELHPPDHEAEIVENSSWSCVHGLGRWYRDCGCCTGGDPGWNQAWRGPLREALDGLRDAVVPGFEKVAGSYLKDPWEARDEYVGVLLDHREVAEERFWSRHGREGLDESGRVQARKLLELQRHAMLMYTSCGWFFDDISRIETVQVLRYAARALQLSKEVLGLDHEPRFLQRLAEARSNVKEHGDGARIYDRMVRPTVVDLPKVAAHFAVSSLFDEHGPEALIHCYRVQTRDFHVQRSGRARLLLGRGRFSSRMTGEAAELTFGVLHLGDHNVQAGVREYRGELEYQGLLDDASGPLDAADLAEVVRVLDRHFGDVRYSLKSLFRDEQRRVVEALLASTLEEAEASLRQLHEHHAPLLRFLSELEVPLPPALRPVAQFVWNSTLRRAIAANPPDLESVRSALTEGQKADLDASGLAYVLERELERAVEQLQSDPSDRAALDRAISMVSLVREVTFEVNLWPVQNLFYEILQTAYPEMLARGEVGWAERFADLGVLLAVRVD